MTTYLFLSVLWNKDVSEHRDRGSHRLTLDRISVQVELLVHERRRAPRSVAMDIREHAAHPSRSFPFVTPPSVSHPDELAQRQRMGIDTGDAGKLPEEFPGIGSCKGLGSIGFDRIASSCLSRFGSSSLTHAID